MKRIDLICVGKLKDSNLEAIETDYKKRINHFELHISEVKASADQPGIEAKNLLKKIDELKSKNNGVVILLSEFGRTFESPEFATWINQNLENAAGLIMVIAGATGFAEEILNRNYQKLSLSPLTFPHKIARIVLIEQIYRAQTIITGHPYHN